MRYWSDEYDPQEIISIIDALLDTDIEEYHDGSGGSGLQLDIFPNPFRASVEISVHSPELIPGLDHVTLSIYDAAGRLVKRFFRAAQLATIQTFQWDGTDMHGNSVPSGVYFINFNSGTNTLTDTVILAN